MDGIYGFWTIKTMLGGVCFIEKHIDLAGQTHYIKGFVNTVWPGNKIVKYNTPMPSPTTLWRVTTWNTHTYFAIGFSFSQTAQKVMHICTSVSGCKCRSVSGKLRAAREGHSPWCHGLYRTESQSVLAHWLMDGWPPKLISLTNVVYT